MVNEELNHERLINSPRGDNVSQSNTTSAIDGTTTINQVTITSGKMGYVYGLNYRDLANIKKVMVNCDGTVKATFYRPPAAITEWSFDACRIFDPPLRANSYAALTAQGTTTVANMDSWLFVYEDDY